MSTSWQICGKTMTEQNPDRYILHKQGKKKTNEIAWSCAIKMDKMHINAVKYIKFKELRRQKMET